VAASNREKFQPLGAIETASARRISRKNDRVSGNLAQLGNIPPASEDYDLPKAAAKLAWKPEDDKEAAN
jgi:hypothetical protein